jgi:F-type H+-transporting ATPase subunit b
MTGGGPTRRGAIAGVTALLIALCGVAVAAETGHPSEHHVPSLADLLFPAINFLIFVYLIRRAGAGAVRNYLQNRRSEIVAALENAATTKRDAEREHAEMRTRLGRVEADAEGIRKDVRAVAELERDRRHELAVELAERIRNDARVMAEQGVRAARATVREETVRAAVAETLAVLRRQIKESDQDRFVREFVGGMDTQG